MSAPFDIGFLLFPDVTQLDLTGPVQVFARMGNVRVHLVWKTLDPVPTDAGFSIVPTATLDACPPLEMICVPGGAGVTAVMEDGEILAWLRERGDAARLVTSVCTGSLVLAAAGLLNGYKATTHWASRDALGLFGIEAVNERVVVDRNRITGGGVTAGIDFAFRVVEQLRGGDEAEAVRLALEYDPAPIGAGGTPETARPEILAQVRERMAARGSAQRMEALRRIAAGSPDERL